MVFFFFFNDTATTEIYTLSLHDALPISGLGAEREADADFPRALGDGIAHHAEDAGGGQDRKSTRLNSSHGYISYAVFCLKKKTKNNPIKYNNINIPLTPNIPINSTTYCI